MSFFQAASPLSRRSALKLGARVTGGVLAAAAISRNFAFAQSADDSSSTSTTPSKEIQMEIEDIINAQGSASDGVFTIEIDRDDIADVTLHGVPILPSFEINGDLNFQSIGNGQVMMNSDLCVKASEMDAFIHELIKHEIVFEAEHQHFFDFQPLVWFVHFRAAGHPTTIAKGVKAALDVTSTPFPQAPPSNPKTPLPADEIGKILGASPEIGSDGVVTYYVPRAETLKLGGIKINPYLNVASQISFEPHGGGQNAAAVPDFNMISTEVNKVVGLMQNQGWDIGCHYNQETGEEPQLYFSHQFKYGNSIALAHEIRNALNLMNVKFN
jgi:hypothetical protein